MSARSVGSIVRRAATLTLVAGLALITACGEPDLGVRFVVPPAYREFVASTSLSIYVPPIAAPFSCDDLAFAEVDADLVRASLVAEIVEREGDTAPLADIDRIAPKLFVAEGFDATGARVIVGCSEVGTIEDDIDVEIRGRPTTRTGTIATSIQQRLGVPLATPVVVNVTDFLGQRLPGADVRWQVIGSSGPGAVGRGTSDGEGRVSIDAALPPRAGPFVLDVRVRWAEIGTAPIPGFVVPSAQTVTFQDRVYDARSGRVGPNGEPGFVVLTVGDLAGTRRVVRVYQAPGTGELLRRVSQSITASDAVLGLLTPVSGRERPVVITRTAWFEVGPNGEMMASPVYAPPPGAVGARPLGVYPAGPCPIDPAGPTVIVNYDADDAAIYTSDGQRGASFNGRVDTVAAGCVSDDDGGEVRMLVVNQPNFGLFVAAQLAPNQFTLREWYALGNGMSFAQLGGAAVLLGTQLSVNDFVVSRLTVARTGPDDFELVMGGLDSPPAPPVANQGGELDGDGKLDVVSLFTRPRVSQLEAPRYALWSVLGREHRGRRVAGDFDLPVPELTDPALLLVDIDTDGADDIIVIERSASAIIPREARVEIYSMGE